MSARARTSASVANVRATVPATEEIRSLGTLLRGMPRSPRQTHGLNESDCEVLRLTPNLYLALSIDSVSEEWIYGLYRDPRTLARVCVQGALSDVVACGVMPTGFLFSPLWPHGAKDESALKKVIFDTVRSELRRADVPLLGGDQGGGASLSLTGVALGTSARKPRSRVGARPGDVLCLTGSLGIGPALGFRYLLGLPEASLRKVLTDRSRSCVPRSRSEHLRRRPSIRATVYFFRFTSSRN